MGNVPVLALDNPEAVIAVDWDDNGSANRRSGRSPVIEHSFFYAVKAGDSASDLERVRNWETGAARNFYVKVIIR